MAKKICLKWNNHTSNLLEVFESLLSTELFVDVTLACEGLSLKAHKIVLSACSPFFKKLFSENPSKHPIVILKDIKYCDLQAVIKFVYSGEVNISQDQLLSFLLTAETLKVKGLEKVTAENRHALGLEKQKSTEKTTVSIPVSPPITQPTETETTTSSPAQRKKKKTRQKRPLMELCPSDEEIIPPKMKGKSSPDIEELFDSEIIDITKDVGTGGGPSSLFMVSLHSPRKNSLRKSSLPVSRNSKTVDDVRELDIEPSNLLEQTLIVENESFVNQNNIEHAHLPSVIDIETPTESIISSDIPDQDIVYMPDSNLLTPIKPEIVLDDDVSPVPGPSHSSEKSLIQADSTGVSDICRSKLGNTLAKRRSASATKRKTATARRKKQSKGSDSLGKDESWKQVLHMCSDCSYTNANIEELVSHVEFHKKSAIQCNYCKIHFTELQRSENSPAVRKNVVDCDICDHCFCSKMALLTHKLLHHY